MKLTLHCDDGGGWLEVPLSVFMRVNADVKKITGESRLGLKGFEIILYLKVGDEMAAFVDAAVRANLTFEVGEKLHDGLCFIHDLARATCFDEGEKGKGKGS